MEQGKKIESLEDLQVWPLAIDLAASSWPAGGKVRETRFS